MKAESMSAGGVLSLTNDELLSRTLRLAEAERRITVEILHHLAEIDKRRAYARLGYPSLWDYALKELKYSEAAAYRRLSAMRALKSHPELEAKIEAGALSVTAISQVQSFLKAEREQAHKIYSKSESAALFAQCEQKSSREVTRELALLSPLALRVQKERVITEDRTEIRFIVDAELLGKIHRVRDLSVPRLKNPASYPELVDLMSELTLDEIDPMRKSVRARKGVKAENESGPAEGRIEVDEHWNAVGAPPPPEAAADFIQITRTNELPSAPEVPHSPGKQARLSRAIPPSLRNQIWKQYGGRCAFVSRETGRRCNSSFGLEIEHCKPHGLGGSSRDAENLRLLCRHHNQWTAIQTYGPEKMEPYLKPKGE